MSRKPYTRDDAVRAVNSRLNAGQVSVRRAIGMLNEAERVLGLNLSGEDARLMKGDEPGYNRSIALLADLRVAREKLERNSKGEAG